MHQKVNIDIVILSYAKNEALKSLTQQAVSSLLASEDQGEIAFKIVVIESNKSLSPYQFEHTQTVYPKEQFGFNKYLNIGIGLTKSPYVCLCNNDLIFHKRWATEILKAMHENPQLLSANPYCEFFHPRLKIPPQQAVVTATKANIFNGILTGWCIFIKRALIEKIGPLDERFSFWYADRDFGRTLLKHKIKHGLVTTSRVDHLGNQSHNAIEPGKFNAFTEDQKAVYEEKWGNDSVPIWSRVIDKIRRS